MKEKQIILLVIAAAIIGGFIAWAYYTRRNEEKSRLRRAANGTNQQRAADQRPLTRQEIRIKKQAHKLAARGRVLPAAQMLEQAGFYRDAIDILENGRLYDEAARVLIRLQRPGRAGVLYSRNGLFGPAAQCFLQAGDTQNAAKCFREIGKPLEAAELFVKSAQFAEAAECFEKANLLIPAAKNWLKINKTSNAIVCWNAIGQDPQQLGTYKPHQEELDIMLQAIKADAELPGILKILAKSNNAANYIIELLSDQSVETAKKIFTQTPHSVHVSILGSINIQSKAATHLVDLYRESGQHRHAGVLLEQLERFEEAAHAFETSGDSERARYCKNRSSNRQNPKIATERPQLQITNQPSEILTAKPAFFIDPGTQSTLQSAAMNPKPDIIPFKTDKFPHEPESEPSGNLQLSSDEITLLSRTWLFDGVNEEDVEQLIGRFTASEYLAGHRIKSGASHTFLVMTINGDFISSKYSDTDDGWLSPEIGLGDLEPVEWVVTSARARTVCIGSADFGSILLRNSDLTRQLYTNLTKRLLRQQDKALISKVV